MIDKDSTLQLDISSFNLSLDVDKNAFYPKERTRQYSLGNSSVDSATAVVNYDLGVFQSKVKNSQNSSSSYFNLDSLFALAEHHINVNASAYSIGKLNSNVELYRAMYERDFNGLRFAIGLMSTWNLQSIASLTTLSSSKIYAASIGNHSASTVINKQQSLTPIYAFLNSPGEVRIYRQGKLLNIQNFPMGNYEIDTSILPFGIYDVTIETVVDGKIVTTQNQTINKSFGAIATNFDKLNWEIYGGYVDFDKKNYVNDDYSHRQSPNQSHLLGASFAMNFPVLSGISFQMSNYGFDKFLVQESSMNVAINEHLSLSWQEMIENYGSHRSIATISTNLPQGLGSLWASREKTIIKGDLPVYDADNYSYGGTFNFVKVIDRAGSFTISNSIDRRVGSNSINYEYSNTLFSGHYGSVGLRTGVQRYHYDNQSSTNEKYINLDFSLPLSTWLSTGISSTNGNIKANIYANKSFENSVITNAGTSVSKLVKGKSIGGTFTVRLYIDYKKLGLGSNPASTIVKFKGNNSTKWSNWSSETSMSEIFDNGSSSIDVFLSNAYLKAIVDASSKSSVTLADSVYTFAFQSPLPESGFYEFTPSNYLVIKPKDYGISIIPADFNPHQSKTGKVGSEEPPIEFNYIVTTSGPRQANSITAKVDGPNINLKGNTYCLFSSDDNKFKVPFSAYLSFKDKNGTQGSYRASCDSNEISLENALWIETPWDRPNEDLGSFYRTNLDLLFPMNDSNSLFTLDGIDWLGTVSASGTITVKAIWTGPDIQN